MRLKMCFCQDYNAQNVFFYIFSKIDFFSLLCMDVQALRPYFNYTLLYKWSFKKVHASESPREILILRIWTKRIVSNYHIGEAYSGFDDGAELKNTPSICFSANIWSDVIIWSFRKTSYQFWSFSVPMRCDMSKSCLE